MEMIKEFYGGASLNSNDAEFVKGKWRVELRYYKIITNMIVRRKKRTKYGIEVVKKCIHNNIISEEKKEIFDCIEKEEVADKVLEILKANKVSPLNVVDILEDLSAKKRVLLIK